jgi:putative tryptophan/tyrosine transport system substrate-binding protein
MAIHIRRRELVFALGGAAAAWPLTARAQQPAMPIVGFLSGVQVPANLVSAFREGLGELGFVEGKSIAFNQQSAGGDYSHFRAIADDFVRRQVGVIFATGGTAAALAAKSATVTIPIVFYMGGDPVGQGLVASLNRPGGNLTGLGWLGFALGAKRLELLREVMSPGAAIGVLVNPSNPDSDFEVLELQQGARILRQELHILNASSDADFDGIFQTLAKQKVGALIVASDAFFSGRRGRIVALATRHGIPAIYERRDFPDAGGLMSYGHHRAAAYRQLGVYVGRILKGEKPADLPVIQPTRFEFVINLNVAKALGLDVPDKLLALADEVIE